MSSLRKNEGYLLIDHRNSPGISDEAAVKAGLPPGAGKGTYESATYTCSHCCRVIVINPLRTRAREYCPKCDKHICDTCGAARAANGGECKTFKQIMEEVQEAAVKKLPLPILI